MAVRKPSFLIAVFVLAALGSAYDIGCLYPKSMPDPNVAHAQSAVYLANTQLIANVETPVIIHRAHISSTCDAMCVATHDASALSVISGKRPNVVAPPFGHNSFSRMLCIAQCYGFFFDEGQAPRVMKPLWDAWGLNVTAVDPILFKAVTTGNRGAVMDILIKKDFHPLIMGQLVGIQVSRGFQDDGWNSSGALTYDPETDSIVPCTANCVTYSDPTGYRPVNPPPRPKRWNKYRCNGRCRRWQPLPENDQHGNIKRQDHVTPHIGFMARRYVRKKQGRVRNPRYSYYKEAKLVIKRMRDTASNKTRQASVDFFDNKLLVRALIQNRVRVQFPQHSFEDHIYYVYWLGAAEMDALLQSWHEKIRWDLVRPTTYIQRWGGHRLFTYNGNRSSSGPEMIAARDFQAYQRVMPHSEYPSASAALCTAYLDFTDAYTSSRYGETLSDLRVGPRHFSVGCNSRFPFRLGCSEEKKLQFRNMEQLRDVCGQSRLWGGMHFTASVRASERLVSGIGNEAFQLEMEHRNGSTWGSSHKRGDPRPKCPL